MKKKLYTVLLTVFILIFVFSAGMLGYYYIGNAVGESRYEELSDLRGQETQPRPVILPEDVTVPPETTEPPWITVTHPKTGEDVYLLPEFSEVFLKNSDLVGWIRIPGTKVDYPVMQTPDSPDYYLKRNFDHAASSRGAIYVREECDVFRPSDNVTIYGHRMQSGAMFGELDKYMQADFCQENPYIYFDTIRQLHTYEIMAVFVTSATAGEGFAYHMFVDAANDAEFMQYVDTCKALSVYETGVTAEPGDKLITLSTCEYSRYNGRLVVVAKLVG